MGRMLLAERRGRYRWTLRRLCLRRRLKRCRLLRQRHLLREMHHSRREKRLQTRLHTWHELGMSKACIRPALGLDNSIQPSERISHPRLIPFTLPPSTTCSQRLSTFVHLVHSKKAFPLSHFNPASLHPTYTRSWHSNSPKRSTLVQEASRAYPLVVGMR